MDAQQFADMIDKQLACDSLDELPVVLRHCWDVDRLRVVKEKIEADTRVRLGLISQRMDQIRGS